MGEVYNLVIMSQWSRTTSRIASPRPDVRRLHQPWAKTSARGATVLLALALSGGPLLASSAPWWNRRWSWRRQVVVSPPQTNLGGDEAAWVELYLNGACKPGGPSIRVTTDKGKPVKHFVMQTGPGDFARVCFALAGRTTKYFIYYGNSEAEAPNDDWRPQRGVLLEGWRYRGGAIASFNLTQQTFRKAGEVTGRTFVPNVFLGHNPFGVPSHYCHKYTGWLVCPKSGQYTFATTSKDASFLLIDDKRVVQWEGRHGAVPDARRADRATLSQGMHKLTYYHVSTGANGRAVAAWQPPGAGRPVVIPPSAFAPVARAACGELDQHATKVQADFTITGPHETFLKNRYTFRYVFEARLTGVRSSGVQYGWDFGDGVTGEGSKVDHVYLTPGLRTVTLKATRGSRQFPIANRLFVNRDWNRVTQPKLEPAKVHAAIVSRYPFEKMSPTDLSSAVWLLNRGKQGQACLAAVEAMPARIKHVTPGLVIRALPEVYDLMVTDLKQPERAARWLETIEGQADDVKLKAAAGTMAGRTYLTELGNLEQAEKCLERVVRECGERTRSPDIRRARLGLGDVYLRTGRYRRARQAIEEAGVVGERQRRNLRVGSYARAVDDFIRRREFKTAAEYLDRWEWEYPLEKLTGYSTLLRAQLYHRQGHYAKLTRLVTSFPMVVIVGDKPTDPVDVVYLTIDPKKLPELYKIDPTTGRIQSSSGTAFPPNLYGMDMGLLAVEGCVNLNQKDQARRVLEVLVLLYPDSVLVGQAKEQLKAMAK